MKKVALLIGVSEYEPTINPLPAAARDLEAMQRVRESVENPAQRGMQKMISENRYTANAELIKKATLGICEVEQQIVLKLSGYAKLFMSLRSRSVSVRVASPKEKDIQNEM
jgi:hypothetical protein